MRVVAPTYVSVVIAYLLYFWLERYLIFLKLQTSQARRLPMSAEDSLLQRPIVNTRKDCLECQVAASFWYEVACWV